MSGIIRHVRARSVSYVALFLALAGTSYAATSVQGRDVADRTLTGGDVRIGALQSNVLEPGAMSAARRGTRGPRGFQGPRGLAGIAGPAGPAGAPGAARKWGMEITTGTVVVAADVNDTSPDYNTAEARCPAGKYPTSGGGTITATDSTGQVYTSPLVHIREMYRVVNTDHSSLWRVIGVEEVGGFDDQWTVTAYAFCVPDT